MDRAQILDQARKILLHPNFPKLTPEQIQVVYRSLMASGVSKEDIEIILSSKTNRHYLESMNYALFVDFVLRTKLQGRDLFALCNSSPLINEKCNMSFNAEGKLIPQYLFYLLLQQQGVSPDPQGNNRQRYFQYLKNVEALLSLQTKLLILEDVSDIRENNSLDDENTRIPHNLYELLYNGEDKHVGFLTYMLSRALQFKYIDRKVVDLDSYDKWKTIDELMFFLSILTADTCAILNQGSSLETQYECVSKSRFDIRKLAEMSGKTLNEFYDELPADFNVFINEHPSQESLLDIFLNIDRLFAETLRVILNTMSEIYIKEEIKRVWNVIVKFQKGTQETREDISEEERLEKVKMLNKILELTEEEIDYIYYLHLGVMNGTIPVTTPFNFEELRKY